MGNAELDNTPRASREHGVEGLQWKAAQPAVVRLPAMNEVRWPATRLRNLKTRRPAAQEAGIDCDATRR